MNRADCIRAWEQADEALRRRMVFQLRGKIKTAAEYADAWERQSYDPDRCHLCHKIRGEDCNRTRHHQLLATRVMADDVDMGTYVTKGDLRGITLYMGTKRYQCISVDIATKEVHADVIGLIETSMPSVYYTRGRHVSGGLESLKTLCPADKWDASNDAAADVLLSPLNEFQQRGLTFLRAMMTPDTPWVPFQDKAGRPFWLNPYSWRILNKEPVVRRGGLVAAAPGSGKTLLALYWCAVHRGVYVVHSSHLCLVNRQMEQHLTPGARRRVTLLTYGQFKRKQPKLAADTPIFCDESHSTQMCPRMRTLLEETYPTHPLFLMTASPWKRPATLALIGDNTLTHYGCIEYVYRNRCIYTETARKDLVVRYEELRCPVGERERAFVKGLYDRISDVSMAHGYESSVFSKRMITMFERIMSGAPFDPELVTATVDRHVAEANHMGWPRQPPRGYSVSQCEAPTPAFGLEDDCCVCLCDLQAPLQAPCGHVACAECFKMALGRGQVCPQCRAHVTILYKPNNDRSRGADSEAPAPKRQRGAAAEEKGDPTRLGGKMEMVRKLWTEAPPEDKFVFFVNSEECGREVSEMCGGVRYLGQRLRGTTVGEEMEQFVAREAQRAIVAHIRWSDGFDLGAANRIVVIDMVSDTAKFLQASSRASRYNQERPVTVQTLTYEGASFDSFLYGVREQNNKGPSLLNLFGWYLFCQGAHKDNLRRQRFEEIKRVVDAIGAQQTTAREQYLKFTGAYTIRYDVVHHTIRAYKGTTLNDIGPSIFTLPPDRIRERLYRATR